jgi:hypothetical protein
MDADLDIASLPGAQAVNEQLRDAITYCTNLPFSDLLPVCKNHKYAGSQVVSLSKKSLPLLSGLPLHHIPYDRAHIAAWFKPVIRRLPEVKFNYCDDYTTPTERHGYQAMHSKNIAFHNDKVAFAEGPEAELSIFDRHYCDPTCLTFSANSGTGTGAFTIMPLT